MTFRRELSFIPFVVSISFELSKIRFHAKFTRFAVRRAFAENHLNSLCENGIFFFLFFYAYFGDHLRFSQRFICIPLRFSSCSILYFDFDLILRNCICFRRSLQIFLISNCPPCFFLSSSFISFQFWILPMPEKIMLNANKLWLVDFKVFHLLD